ncbi:MULTISPECIES: hypothetical protein [Pectobacterium]|uniref:Lysogenic conversion protein from Bacteriophage P2-EC53 n=1 Tax=Pectobacterium parmentieri TaxID=1905730 RepID=A0A0H3I4F9_PECPM|nr:hypothetical protein [Pectobacterium parmentieri]AFI89568.1 Putative lysogenic conversion protein from Bacteriophage P2-EC53 [Pectobacterium parmentieri]MBI0473309.1 hypothetical protein [Pectobacterium parmentieri]MBI0495926.1 hypothetical protein [Pectobacterium parmentieri]MBI0557336.1 hypothetical protein [Pectobacterium parmentieri]MBI0570475.1 hypothetical protein [Pectobacterium parmentieri]
MEGIPSWVNTIIAIGGALGTIVTAVATFFLWRVTKTLAHETTRMVEASSQPHVVVTLTPNRWSMHHFDIHIDNTGNATAYDISIAFDPPLKNGEAHGEQIEIPFQKISVLKPGQGIMSYLSEFKLLKGNTYQVDIIWKRDASSQQRQKNSYTLNMADHEGISRLGDDPLIEIVKSIKKIEENWSPVAKGQKRTKVDVFSGFDRLHERRQANRMRRQWQREKEANSLTNAQPDTLNSQQ